MRERVCPQCRSRLRAPEVMPSGAQPLTREAGRGREAVADAAPPPSFDALAPRDPVDPPSAPERPGGAADWSAPPAAASPPPPPAPPPALPAAAGSSDDRPPDSDDRPSVGGPRLAVPRAEPAAGPAPGSRGGPPPVAGWNPELPPIPGVDDVRPPRTPPPAAVPTSDRIPPKVVAAVIGVAVLLLVVGALVVGSGGDDDETAADDPVGQDERIGPEPSVPFSVPPVPDDDGLPAGEPQVAPEEWDPLVADLAAFVEEERDLRFEEPVTVELVSGDELTAEFDVPVGDPFVQQYIDDLLAQYRGLGIIQGAPDVLGQMQQSTDIGLLGYYDPEIDVIRVRNDVGGEAGRSPFQRAVLVHELTHALQDQHTDLAEPVWSQEELTMQRMMVEGDARRIERAYVASLPPEEQQQFEDTIAGIQGAGAEAGLLGVLGIEGTVVYEGGAEVTRLVDTLDSSEAVDLLLQYPPDRPAQLMRVSSLFLHGQEPWAEDAPDADYPDYPLDAFAYDGGSLGAWMWYVTLATRIDPGDALRAADAIGSDRYVLYEQGGRNCANYELVPSGAVEAAQLVKGMRDWASSVPHGATVAVARDGIVTVTVCDPGAGADMRFVRSPNDIVDGPIARVGAVADVLERQRGWWIDEELKERERWCLAETVQRAVSQEEALAGLPDDRLAQLGEDAVKACLPDRVPGGPPPFEGECSAAGMEYAPTQEGLPDAVQAARTALLVAAVACDFAAVQDLLAPNGPYIGDGALPPPDDRATLGSRWRRQEENGLAVLADLVSALDAGFICGPAVVDALDGREGTGCAWLWGGPSTVDAEATVAMIGERGAFVGFGDNPEVQTGVLALWAETGTGARQVDAYTFGGTAGAGGFRTGWPAGVPPAALLRAG